MKGLLVALCLISSLMIVDNAEASRRSGRSSVVIVQSRGSRVVVQSQRGFSRSRNQVNVFVR